MKTNLINQCFPLGRKLSGCIALLTLLTVMFLSNAVLAQTPFPFVFQNNSTFADADLYVAIVGQNASGSVWIDCQTGAVNPMTNTYNTVLGPTYGGNKGPGGNSMYASCFRKLSDVPNKTVMLPGISGCRVFISVGQQLYFYFFANGGYTSPSSTDPTDPNQGIRYELIELTFNSIALFANTTRVDSYQYPMGLEMFGANGYHERVGELKTHNEIVALWQSSVPVEFQKCLNTANGIITAPSKTLEFADGTIGTMPTPGPYVDYLKPYIDQVWTKYTNEDLIFNAGDAGVFKGRIVNGRLTLLCTGGGFNGRTGIVTTKPTTQEVLEGKGVFNQSVNDTPVDLAVQAQMTAALNRHAINVTTPNVGQQDFANSANYYLAAPTNYYSKFWHLPGVSIGQLSYGFAYDDVFNYSSSLVAPAPTKAVAVFGGWAGLSIDTQAPTTPTNLTSPSKTSTSVNLTWTASTDNVGVSGYDVFVNAENTPRVTVTTTAATIGSLTANTAYTFKVRAKDAANNVSGFSGTLSVTTNAASSSQTIPATIEAESYTAMNGVQLEATGDTGGGQNVGWIDANDWMDYNVNASAAGTYAVAMRVASAPGGGQMQIRNSAGTSLATVNIAATGGWQTWTTLNTSVTLPAGVQTLRVFAVTAGWNFNWMQFTSSSNVAVTGVTVSPTTATLNVGTTQQLTATVSPANATNKNVTWSSGNAGIASVSTSGLVTAVAPGSVTITVTTQDGNKTAASSIIVNATNVAVTGVTVSPATASINVGATQQLTATVAPSNATNKNVTWSSSNAGIASVSTSGLVTGVAAGSATITVTTQDGNKTATSTITVTTASATNLALNKPAFSSCDENAGTTPSLAVDGNLGTRWSSCAADPQWIYVDLGANYNITRVKISWEAALGKDYQIQLSSNLTTWTSIKTITGNTALINDHTGLIGSGRYVRMYGTARGTGYGYSIWELEVYGTPGNTNTPPTANAGADKSITLPTNSVVINGTGSDPGGSISAYAWTRVSGPNTPTLTNANTANLTASGLIAGTYVFRLTVTDNGGLTASDDVNVVVNPTATNTNIALNKLTTVSSTENAGTPGSAAVDGNAGTRWSSAAADPQWIYVDLGSSYNVNRVKITWEAALGKDYQVQTATAAAGPWTTIKTITGNAALVNDNTGLTGTGRYVRVYGTARGTGYGYSIWELEVYGSAAARSAIAEDVDLNPGSKTLSYPNPASSVYHFDGLAEGTVITVRSITGGEAFITKIVNGVIDISHLQAGTYITEHRDGKKSVRNKFVKP
jgi:uncharacterized protein YjdB